MDTNVVQFDPVARARELASNWRCQPLYVLVARSQALLCMQANGVRLPREVHEAWLQMSAMVAIARACGR